MVLINGIALVAGLVLGQQSSQEDPGPLVRRIAATSRLATQEYRLGVSNGKIVAPEEIEEARLFLTEAGRSAALLPPDVGRPVLRQIDSILALVRAVAPADSVTARVSRLATSLAQKLGVSLDETPAAVPSLARGAQVYQQNCASCHGMLGRGDGPAASGMNPAPANLSDAATLRSVLPLDYFQRVTIGVTGTAMPAFESRLSAEDRWAAAAYATLLRLPAPSGEVPPALRSFATTARLSDSALAAALVPDEPVGSALAMSRVAAVRNYQVADISGNGSDQVFARVRAEVDSSLRLAEAGKHDEASTVAFDAYMTFEQVESQVRAKDNALAGELEAIFAELRTRAAGGATSLELKAIQSRLLGNLERAERTLGDRLSAPNLFFNSFVILLREGLEAILILGALVTMLAKLGAGHRKRDVHIGAIAAVAASLVTAVVLQTLIRVKTNQQEALEGVTMLVAVLMLFYVSYWLLSKMEVAKWNRFVKGKVEDALTSGSALALASVAFLAVYREGFETVLFYKALFVAGGSGTAAMPVLGGILAGAVILLIVYYAINRYGVKIPLKPFFGVTSGFLYYMAFVFAGKGIAELQEGGLVSLTPVNWAPRIPQMGIYQTVETLTAQGILLALFLAALLWTFVLEPRRLRVTSQMVPEAVRRPAEAPETGPNVDRDMIRSLERMDADLAELRAEVERLKQKLQAPRS
ncbi:MAG TPA: FTR1 family protein [Gemmatimonadales bacterium]|nr:FTR1 family protein [Gemmatimonadales bacterium]